MKIDGIHDALNAQNLPQKKQNAVKADEGVKQRKDKLEISSEAKKLSDEQKLQNLAKAHLGAISDVRQEKIDEVRSKLASHYYDQDRVISDMAGKMTQSKDLAHAVARENYQAANINSDDVKKLAVVFNRIDRGVYDSDEVLKAVANKLKTYLSQLPE